MQWRKIAIVGVGLLGGSLGLAVKRSKLAQQVYGYVRRPENLQECERQGAIDRGSCDLLEVVADADLIVLCTPIAQMRELAGSMLPGLRPETILTDVGSVKSMLAEQIEPLLEGTGAYYVGSHPMAGAETMGVRSARADLFQNAVCAITPTPRSAPIAVRRLEEFWQSVGARPMVLSPRLHDEFVARSSHLPHVIAAEVANYVLSPAHPKEQAQLCAGGFRDMTRIAAGSPEMWRDIALANRANLSRALAVFIEDLQEFNLALEQGEPGPVQEFFELAKRRRDQWSNQASSNSPE